MDGIQWDGRSAFFPGSRRLQQHLGLYTGNTATSSAHLWYVRNVMNLRLCFGLIQCADRRPGSNVCIFVFPDAPITAARARAGESTVRGKGRKRMVATFLGEFEVGHGKALVVIRLSSPSTESKKLRSSCPRDRSLAEKRRSSL